MAVEAEGNKAESSYQRLSTSLPAGLLPSHQFSMHQKHYQITEHKIPAAFNQREKTKIKTTKKKMTLHKLLVYSYSMSTFLCSMLPSRAAGGDTEVPYSL